MTRRNFKYVSLIVFISVISAACAEDAAVNDESEKTFYYLGTALSRNLVPMNLSEDELKLVIRGLREALHGEAMELDDATYGPRLNEIVQERMAVVALAEEEAAADYIEKMAAEDGAVKTESGLIIRELVVGDGDSPTENSVVKAHYHGSLRDGSVFDSSVERGQPFTSALTNVIPCWREAIPMMKEGGKSKITCPSEIAYGSRGSGAIPGGAALTFEVELIEVVNQ